MDYLGACNIVTSVNLTPKVLAKHKSECRENRITATLPQSDYVRVAYDSLRAPRRLATTSVLSAFGSGCGLARSPCSNFGNDSFYGPIQPFYTSDGAGGSCPEQSSLLGSLRSNRFQ